MTKIRINLCASPRNISTALMYSFGNRTDMSIVDEPLYAYYLKNFDIDYHPGKNEILATMNNNAEVVIDEMVNKDFGTDYVFFKNMTHHYKGLTENQLEKMLSNTKNIVLVRNPYEMIRSFSKVIKNPTIDDLGINKQAKLVKYLHKLKTLACVIDSTTILKNPRKALRKICECCDIPFDKNMLNWKAGAKKEDGVWAKYWYKNVHQSTAFKPYIKSEEKIPPHLTKLYKECEKFYNEIKPYCLDIN